jgi:subtilase family serine protease
VLAVAAPAGAASQSKVALRNSESPAAARTPQVGSVSSGTQISFEVDLKLANQQAAEAFGQAVSTPGSSSYRKFLTPAQWETTFSPTAAEITTVRNFLSQNGFKVGGVSADRMAVTASGTAHQIEQAFGTSLSYHRVNGKTLRLADKELSVPSNVAGVIGGVTGVSETIATPSTSDDAAATPDASSKPNVVPPVGFRNAPPCGSYYGQQLAAQFPALSPYPTDPPYAPCGYTPPQIRSAYGLTDANNGTGRTVAIVDAYAAPTLFQDGHQYAALNDPGNPLKSSQFSELLAGNYDDSDICQGIGGWYGEQTLDVEAVHSTAPGANILFAGARNCTTTWLNKMLRQIVDGHLADVVSNSYGDDAGDLLDSADDRQSTDNILLMAVGTGVSVMFSSGDDGDEFTTVGAVAPDYPASSPWATAVGGTTLQVGASGQRSGEYGWSTARAFFCNADYAAAGGCTKKQVGTWLPLSYYYGGGGGTSFVYPQPAYQKGVVPTTLSKLNSAQVGPQPMRVEPDVSMDGDPTTGLLVGETQTFPNGVYYDQYRIGGTSLSSPLMAGMVARADQETGGSLGFLNPKLYSLYGKAAAYDDIIQPSKPQDIIRADYIDGIDNADGIDYSARTVDYQGQETFCTSPTKCSSRKVALKPTAGYDNMTGLGSPAGGFVNALSH